YDLKGYPAIKHNHPQHIGSRLTALSDQFDAMRSNRPYRDALKADQILEIMEKDKGTGLDPDLFDRFTTMLKSRNVT
ncbi:MAG: HD-GYP domain-containing protein, partial [Nitrospiria bacterium]